MQAGLFGVQMVAPRSNRAWVKSAGRARAAGVRAEGGGGGGDGGLGGGQRRVDGGDAGADALDVAINGNDGLGEGDAGDGGSGVGANARKAAEGSGRGGESAVRHLLRTGMHVAGASVVAEAGPGLHHLGLGSGGERGDRRETLHEAGEIRYDGSDRGLLQHDFAEPDVVGIGRYAGQGAPGHGAAVAIVPLQQVGGRGGRHGTDMAEVTPPGNRFVWGPRPVGALVPGVTRAAFRARSPAAAQIVADWAAIVGPALAATTTPRRLQGGTLVIGCAGPVAMELQHVAVELVARINMALGRATVERLRFVQDFLPVAARARVAREAPAPVPVQGVAAGDLHDALARLGGAILAKREGA